MEVYERNLHINDEAFEGMRIDADRVLQKLIKNMVEKGALEGSLTIKIDVLFQQEYIPNYDPEIKGERRKVLIPSFSHKVGSVMQIKDEAKGGSNYEGFELVWDEEAGEFVMKPIANTEQKTIFDADPNERTTNKNAIVTSEEGDFMNIPLIEGEVADETALPGPYEPEDISDEFRENETLPFSGEDDGYQYEEPNEED